MPVYEFVCKNGHRSERILHFSEFVEEIVCDTCRKRNRTETVDGRGRAVRARLVVSHTAKPILKRGIGGFHSPSD